MLDGTAEVAQSLATALAVGLLIGLERGWRDRNRAEGTRIAGLRTFALVGLLGGGAALLGPALGPWPMAAALASLAALLAVSYGRATEETGSVSLTGAVAALLTFVLGALAASGFPVPAVAAAVVTALILGMKTTLHQGLRRIEPAELASGLQLLVLSLVVLPLLPDRNLGPMDALNPYRLWWAVVLVAALSMGGHFAMRLGGPQRGMLWAGLIAGLASSTAATFALARQGRTQPALAATAATAIVAACAMMFMRMAVVVVALQPDLSGRLAVPLIALGATTFAAAWFSWRVQAARRVAAKLPLDPDAPPFDLRSVLAFGALLAVVALVVRYAVQVLGTPGLLAVAGIAGLADVDAITISTIRMHGQGIVDAQTATLAALLAAAANLIFKGAVAWIVGGSEIGRSVARAFAAVLSAGVVAMVLTIAI